MLDWHITVRGRNRSSGHVFLQGDVQGSWWINHRLEVIMLQPPPTLKSSSTLLSQNNISSLEENKEKVLEGLTTTCEQGIIFRTGKSLELSSIYRHWLWWFTAARYKGFEKVQGPGRQKQCFSVSLSKNSGQPMPLLTQIYLADLFFPWVIHHGKVRHGPLLHLAWEATTGNIPDLLEKQKTVHNFWHLKLKAKC